jgi:hypothetical protein
MVPGLVLARVYSVAGAPGHAGTTHPPAPGVSWQHHRPLAALMIQENKTQPWRRVRPAAAIKRLMAVVISSKLAGNDGQQKRGDEIPLPIQQNDVGEKS